MTLASNTNAFAGEVGGDVKALYTLITGAANIASLVNLKTDTKANLVAALNELFDDIATLQSNSGAIIDDNNISTTKTYSSSKTESVATAKASAAAAALISDGTTAAGTTWSSTKINSQIGTVVAQVQQILAGSSAAYDTFKEISDYIAADTSGAAAMNAAIANRIQVDAAQSFTAGQLTQGLANLVTLGVAKNSDLQALITGVGNTSTDFRATYLAARNS